MNESAFDESAEYAQSVFQLYQNYDFENAVFLAERSRAAPNGVSALLLAECYIADQRYPSAYHVLRGQRGDRARYLFALCCVKLNREAEAEETLSPGGALDAVPNGAFGLQLLARCHEKADRKAAAADCYLRAYRANPLLFFSLERYLVLAALVEGHRAADALSGAAAVPEMAVVSELFRAALGVERPQSPPPEALRVRREPPKSLVASAFDKSRWRRTESFCAKPISRTAKPRSPTRIAAPTAPTELLRALARPYMALINQNSHAALEGFLALGPPLVDDPWVLVQLGRCCTELYDHARAEQFFGKAFERDPQRLHGLEYYSSCLYHLKRQTELAQLASTALSQHFFRVETWIVLANCFSLSGDHSAALTFLGRAIQLDPFSSYAHCLAGHEHLARESFEQAKEAYQKALNIDPRNIRALWGLGIINMKMEKFDRAIHFFSDGLAINDKCSPFYTQLASAYLNKREFEKAYFYVEKAERLSPSDSFNRFIKAQILNCLQRFEEALRECQTLSRESQREAGVFVLMGQIQHSLGRVEEAFQCFSVACSLDKKDSQRVKALIEGLHASNSTARPFFEF